MAEIHDQEDHNEEEDFNPIGTVWVLAIFFLMIIAFWGYAYIEMILGA